MTKEFNTEIVITKEFNKIFMIIFGILYVVSTFYIFLYDRENQNLHFKYSPKVTGNSSIKKL